MEDMHTLYSKLNKSLQLESLYDYTPSNFNVENTNYIVTFNDDLIKQLQVGYVHLQACISQNRSQIKKEYELNHLSNVKRVDAKSVEHLSKNTQYIQSISNNRVIPSKLLSANFDDDLITYENRMLKTVLVNAIDYLQACVETYYKHSYSQLTIERELYLTSTFKLKINEVCVLEKLLKQYQQLLQYRFIKDISSKDLIRNEILLTNTIKHDVHFFGVYKLNMYISAHDISYHIARAEKEIDSQIYQNYMALTNKCIESVYKQDHRFIDNINQAININRLHQKQRTQTKVDENKQYLLTLYQQSLTTLENDLHSFYKRKIKKLNHTHNMEARRNELTIQQLKHHQPTPQKTFFKKLKGLLNYVK